MKRFIGYFFLLFFTGLSLIGLSLIEPSYAKDCSTLSKETCPILQTFKVAGPNTELNFKHFCSTLDKNDGFSYSAYVFFEQEHPLRETPAKETPAETKPVKKPLAKKSRALVLGELSAGWVSSIDPQTDVIGFGLSLDKMRIEDWAKWAGANFSLALEIKDQKTNHVVTGPFSKTYFYSYQGSGYPVDKQYSLSDKGSLEWIQLVEPEEQEKDSQTEAGLCSDCDKVSSSLKRNEYKGSEFIEINKKHIKNLGNKHTFYLVLRNEATGETVRLKGPNITDLKAIFSHSFSRPRALTWEVLNPLQQGGLFDVIVDAFKYQDCIYLRKKAKKDFDKHFSLVNKKSLSYLM